MICGKVIYQTRPEALSGMSGIHRVKNVQVKKSKKQPNKAYYCDECKGWHVATAKKRYRTPILKEPSEIYTAPRHSKNQLIHIVNFSNAPIQNTARTK